MKHDIIKQYKERSDAALSQKYGLTTQEAEASRAQYGRNELSRPPKETFWQKFAANLKDPMIRILTAAPCHQYHLCLYGTWRLAGNGGNLSCHPSGDSCQHLFGICQRKRLSETPGRSLSDFLQGLSGWGAPGSRHCRYRKGRRIILQAGDKVPADGVMLAGTLKVDQSVLNGESEEAPKIPGNPSLILDPEKVDFLQTYAVYRGSVVLEGEGIMRADCIGDLSVYGKLTQELKDNERESPLKHKLRILLPSSAASGIWRGLHCPCRHDP